MKPGVFLVYMCAKSLQLCRTLCDPSDCSNQPPLSMGFPRQGYWSGLPWPPPGDLPNPRIEPVSLMSPALVVRFFTTIATWEGHFIYSSVYMSVNPNLPVYPSTPFPLVTIRLFSTSVTRFLFVNKFIILAVNTFSELCYLEIGAISVIILVPKKPTSLELCVLAVVLLVDQNLIFVSVPATVTCRTSPRVSLQ